MITTSLVIEHQALLCFLVIQCSCVHLQERYRYSQPHKAFTFRMHGFESVVGPVKGVFDKETSLNKAREHSLLRSDRPAYVTILSLGKVMANKTFLRKENIPLTPQTMTLGIYIGVECWSPSL